MTNHFKQLLYIFKCAVHGTKPDIDTNLNFNELFKISVEQNVWIIIYEVFSELYIKKCINTHSLKIMNEYKIKVLKAVFIDMKRKERIKNIFDDCNKANIDCILLKGYLFADLYHAPQYRISSDIDLYVNSKDERKVMQILKRHKFECNKKLKTEYHRECTNEDVGLLELHTFLYDDFCQKIWFDNYKDNFSENYIKLNMHDGYEYKVLGYTDNYIFNVLHLVKHFISGGVNIRQLTDVMLYTKKYKNLINLEKVICDITKMHYDVLLDTLSLIAVKYIGFKEDELIFFQKEIDCNLYIDRVLNSIENSKMFFENTFEFDDFTRIYTATLLQQNKSQFITYNCKKILHNGILNSIFVSAAQLSSKYNYAKNHKFFLPVAWCHRIINYLLQTKRVKSSETNAKLKLLYDLKVIDDK